MNRYEMDHHALKKPLIFLLLAVAVVSTIHWMSGRFLSERDTGLQQARSRLDTLRGDYRDAIEAGNIIHSSLANYYKLQQRGFIGDEQRLLWIESLRISGNDSRLSGLQYSLKQQQAVDMQNHAGQYYQLLASDMELRLDLLHEGTLLEFFEQLEKRKPAVYQVRSCSLTSTLDGSELSLDTPNITAVCQLRWFTVRDFNSVAEYTEEVF